MLHEKESGYVEAEAYRSEIFLKIRKRIYVRSVYPYIHTYIYILKYKKSFVKFMTKNYMIEI